jgi:DNA-directed RNA polymerase specialized sigma subunit
MTPKARADHILVHHVQDEVVVYDRDRRLAHRLDSTATRVWQSLDGTHSAREVADRLAIDEREVRRAITRIDAANLLDKG